MTKGQIKHYIGLALNDLEIGEDDCGDRQGLYDELADFVFFNGKLEFYTTAEIIKDYTGFYDNTPTEYAENVIHAMHCMLSGEEYARPHW